MILSGREIAAQQGKGIEIIPFSPDQVNPNSYNLKLHNELLVYDEDILDMKKENSHHLITIPEEGLVLQPGRLYLGRTVEYTRTHSFVPMLEGRSSVGRLGLFIHVTAGFGRWSCTASSRCGSSPMWISARSITTPSRAAMTCTTAISTTTTRAFSPA